MEQKQLDEIDESYFGEEFIDDVAQEEIKIEKATAPAVKEKPAKKTTTRKKTTAKKATTSKAKATKSTTKSEPKVEKKAEPVETKTTEKKPETVAPTPMTSATKPAEKKPVQTFSPTDPWDDEETDSGLFSSAGTWKALTGILIILLIFSVFTNGFTFDESSSITGGAALSLTEAEQRTLNFVNTQLLQPPFVAEVLSSEESNDLFKITLSVAGDSVDSYLTKDGELFFPQGFLLADLPPTSEESFDEPTPAPVTEVTTENDPFKGDENAPVTIIEFSDFQCPFCAQFSAETLPLLEENYLATGKAKLVFKDFPLPSHPEGQPAALAAACAQEQGVFWEFHDALFENQQALSTENYLAWATDLGMDEAQFTDCFESQKYLADVQDDIAQGSLAGVTGTPGFLINGKLLSGAQPFAVFAAEIDAALAAAGVTEEPVEVPTEEELAPIEDPVEEPVAEPEPTPVGETVSFDVAAKKWLFTPQDLTVNQGDTVQLHLQPAGLDFTFAVPQFGVEQEVSGATTVEFTADTVGTFEFSCSSCEDWRGMTGTLTVE